ncbi:L-type lectin-domain containing receptor kinase S.1 [Acorus calamus]|uniref:non-specific serine/threonine protein kinase n=1 Tax=Acorus calamus TaxID=4465 RepID=A0AAV9CLH0_ACOCL|nr:L-type lectin-domain containing receptor kinase S.1 [Acorus calamus]
MRSGRNIRAWIEFDARVSQINVTIAPVGVPKPTRPLISYTDPAMVDYLSDQMFVGFSASKVQWVEAQRVLAWSFSDAGIGTAREINTSDLPVFLPTSDSSNSSLSAGAIAGISSAGIVLGLCLFGLYCWFRIKNKKGLLDSEEEFEEWEMNYWPHRFSYEELYNATKGFSRDGLLGFGGFGKVYKGVLPEAGDVAVKCVSHDSKQGLREFMAEVSSIGRLKHKGLVPMRGWCRRGTELMLVYDYMPNGSLNKWIFDDAERLLDWEGRQKVLVDVAEALHYLHHGWDQVVLHRDIKAGNILLDSEMRGRLGDFGLAKLYQHGQAPSATRVVGTLGYLAPELARLPAPTAASDVYGFGVVALEVACGRRPIDGSSDDEPLLVDWVRGLYDLGKLLEAADVRLEGRYDVAEMELVLKLGLACCHPIPENRPMMKDVVELLIGEKVAIQVGVMTRVA